MKIKLRAGYSIYTAENKHLEKDCFNPLALNCLSNSKPFTCFLPAIET